MYDMEREKNMLRWVEEEPRMSPAEMDRYYSDYAGGGYLAVLENRAYPIHDVLRFPARWLEYSDPYTLRAEGNPGEYYAFQLAVFAKEDIGALTVGWEGNLPQPDCFNLGGIGCDGKPFSKTVSPVPGRVQPLWFGFSLPESGCSSVEGTLILKPEKAEATTLHIHISVEGDVLADCGDSEPWRHSRLRWLNSAIAQDDEITAPFAPLTRKGSTISGLGHSVILGKNGLPEQLTSAFSLTVEGISLRAREILAAPIGFGAPEQEAALTRPLSFTEEKPGIIRWESEWNSGDIAVSCEGKMEYDGYQEYALAVEALEDTELDDLALRIPYRADCAKDWMGMGKQGGLRAGELDWQWDESRNQDTLWMGDVNAGLMVRLKDDNYRKPFMLIYYRYHPLVMPEGWDNGGRGSCTVRQRGSIVPFEAHSGKVVLRKGQSLSFRFDLSPTPVKPIDKAEHWLDHYYHAVPGDLAQVSAKGANVINIHHGNSLNPYINYPFFETERVAELVEECHKNALRLKLYYTVKEITVRTPEFWAFKSLGDEIVPTTWEIGESFQGSIPYADDWLREQLTDGYMTAWRQKVENGEYQ
ncbi:MAG: glycoside hydrolase domain-containing protein, partial [Oscillospiraceae bacterium]